MIALGWDGRRIMQAVSQMYRSGIAGMVKAADRALLREFLRARLGPEFPLPLRSEGR